MTRASRNAVANVGASRPGGGRYKLAYDVANESASEDDYLSLQVRVRHTASYQAHPHIMAHKQQHQLRLSRR